MSSDQRYLMISPRVNHQTTAREEGLVLTAKAGSHAAFGELQQTYSHRLFTRILSITRNREDAEDALQDTFLRAYRSLPSFEGRSKFSSWLTRIAINSALAVLRKHRSRPEISLEQQPSLEDDAVFVDVANGGLNPEELYDQKQRSRAIQHSWYLISVCEVKTPSSSQGPPTISDSSQS
jgi:RNA polymerase sigma-70 factor (ECF subfamily)